jgi:hypothetical protein
VRTFVTLLDPEPLVPGRLSRFLAPIPSVSLTSNLMDVLMALSRGSTISGGRDHGKQFKVREAKGHLRRLFAR